MFVITENIIKRPVHVVHSFYGVFKKLTNDQGNASVSPEILLSELPYHSHYYFESLTISVGRL